MEKSSAFNERMSSVLSAIDTAMGQSEREGGQEHTEHSDGEIQDTRRSRSPVDRDREHRYQGREHHRGESSSDWRRGSPGDRRGRSGESPKGHRDESPRYRRSERPASRSPRGESSRDWRRDRGRRFQQSHRGRQKHKPPPDHVMNPSKWTKYDLSTDGTEALKKSGMTEDQVNSFAAFQFLRELRERREREGREEEEEGGSERVVFKNPRKSKKDGSMTADDAKPKPEGGNVVSGAGVGAGVIKMAEYVVGGGAREKGRGSQQRKGRSERDLDGAGVKRTSCVSLSHLAEEDEEED